MRTDEMLKLEQGRAEAARRVGEVGEGTGELPVAAKGAATLAAREVVLAVGRLATPGDIATGVVRAG